MIMKDMVKQCFRAVDLDVSRHDRLLESIPINYEQSPYLPRVNFNNLKRQVFFDEIIRRTKNVDGDIVECGVSIGHGLLTFILLSEIHGISRTFYGYDSFEGFPAPSGEDDGTHSFEGYYSSPSEIVEKVLADGRVPAEVRKTRVRLVKGFFEETVADHEGQIALLNLDCDLYLSYQVCLENLYDKVATGGIILFDEYNNDAFPGARRAVDEFLSTRPECVEQHELGMSYAIKA